MLCLEYSNKNYEIMSNKQISAEEMKKIATSERFNPEFVGKCPDSDQEISCNSSSSDGGVAEPLFVSRNRFRTLISR